MSPRSAQLICLIPGIACRCRREQFGKAPLIDSLEKARRYIGTLFLDARYERFYMLCLDRSLRLTACQMMLQGTVGEIPFYPRLVAELALRAGAFAAILAHNHPGGTASFSSADMTCTKDAASLLRNLDVLLLDHLLYAKRRVYSIRERRLANEGEWFTDERSRAFADRWIRAGE